jgi:hypothetical protein
MGGECKAQSPNITKIKVSSNKKYQTQSKIKENKKTFFGFIL